MSGRRFIFLLLCSFAIAFPLAGHANPLAEHTAASALTPSETASRVGLESRESRERNLLTDAEKAESAESAELTSSGDDVMQVAEQAAAHAMNFIGVRYKYGGISPETGFDCSGLVKHVFETLGAALPRTAREMSRRGERIQTRSELQPGDLVFFNTMRRAFSHVGIYLGNHQFIHAPSKGGRVRVEDLRTRYWVKRYDGARRIEASAPTPRVAQTANAADTRPMQLAARQPDL